MKQFFLLLLCTFSTLLLFAQKKTSITEILSQPVQELEVYDTSGFGTDALAIRFHYGSPVILNPRDYQTIAGYGKVSVEYIYSKYTQSQPGQKELDRNRFLALQRLAPDLFDDPGIQWDVTVQTGATQADTARKLFHGFVIRYQPPITEARKEEIREELDATVECAKKRPPADAPKYPGGPEPLKTWLETHIKFPKEEALVKGTSRMALVEFQVDTAAGRPCNIRVNKGVSPRHNDHIKAMIGSMSGWSKGNPAVVFSIALQFSLDESGNAKFESMPLKGYNPKDCQGIRTDSTVMKILERNKNWKKMLVVEDVTGSMMPYVADLLLWNALKSNLQNTNHFVFFNDGDGKSDLEKVVGSTGGLYHAKPKNVELLEETMISAIAGGNGDDTPENDIEAVLAGIKSCPECEEVVLISDNDATPRDLELVSQVTKPVHVILCGVRYAPNPAHLYIAWKTKGSLHTIREDITQLANMEEGQSITVMGKTFKILKGKFVPLGKM